jgi:hypothetical protein
MMIRVYDDADNVIERVRKGASSKLLSPEVMKNAIDNIRKASRSCNSCAGRGIARCRT